MLYDRTSGNVPGSEGWIPVIQGSTTETYLGGSQLTELNTTANRGDQSGYFSEDPFIGALSHPLMPTLDRSVGFTIRFDLQVVAEGHNLRDDNGDGEFDRAGFSVIKTGRRL